MKTPVNGGPAAQPAPPRFAGHIVAAFAPLPALLAGQHLTREHAVCLDAYRHACGMSAWLDQPPGTDVTVTAAQVNRAVTWWNSWHKPKAAGR